MQSAEPLDRPRCPNILLALRSVALAMLGLTLPTTLPADESYEVDAKTGFRMERYRAPVPQSVPGGTTVDTGFITANPAPDESILIDVYPPPGLGADPLDGHWIISEPRQTLPGAIWLPEVGRGYLDETHEDYFRRNLERLSAAQPDLPIVFFCTADCWQSWNAAKRAADWGYDNIHWYAEGTDGWREAGLPMVAGQPLNFHDDKRPEQ